MRRALRVRGLLLNADPTGRAWQVRTAAAAAAAAPPKQKQPAKPKRTASHDVMQLKASQRQAAKESQRLGLNTMQLRAFDLADEGSNLLLIGAAGTGKSEVTRRIRQARILSGASVASCAPYGVAACNVNGFTIHSTFGIGVNDLHALLSLVPGSTEHKKRREVIAKQSYKSRKDLWKTIDTLIIDEISTCNAETFALLDYMAKLFKSTEEPFGGIQVIAVGDFLQLPPVEGKWAFSCDEFKAIFGDCVHTSRCVELTEVVRQADDPDFMELLNVIRNLDPNCDTNVDHLFVRELLERTCNVVASSDDLPKECVRIVPLRIMAERYNNKRMAALNTDGVMYVAYDSLMEVDKSMGESSGEKLSKSDLQFIDTVLTDLLNNSRSETRLELRKGARVMQLTNNHHAAVSSNASSEEQVVNGHTGTIVGFVSAPKLKGRHEAFELWCQLRTRDGLPTDLPMVQWDHAKKGKHTIVMPVLTQVGDGYTTRSRVKRRIQLPLAPAWAMTAHKCQGMTLEGNVSVSLAHSFAAGQCYVALSRSKVGNHTFLDGVDNSIRGLYASREALDFLNGLRAATHL